METPLHQRPIVWLATVGALLLVVGLSLRSPQAPTTPANDLAVTPEIAALTGDVAATIEARVAPESAPPEAPVWRDFTVRNGDNLSLVFARAGFSDTDLYRVAEFNERQSLRKIYPGETIGFQSDEPGSLHPMRHVASPLATNLPQGTTYGF